MTPLRPANVTNARDHPWLSYGKGRYVRETKRLGPAVGTVALGFRLERVAPGKSDVPLHWHLAEEEGFLALDGAGVLVQTDADGQQETRTPFAAGDGVVFPADRRVGHRFDVPDDAAAPLTYLVFGERAPVDFAGYPGRNTWLVRKGTQGADAARKDGLGVLAATPVDYYEGLPDKEQPAATDGSPSEFRLPARFGETDGVAPPSYAPIVHLADVPSRTFGKGRYERHCVQLAPHLGAERFDINLDTVPPGHVDGPLHHHLGDEELFYILEGEGRLRMHEHGAPQPTGTPISAGDCISFPAATGIAHQIAVAEDAETPLRMLTLATRAPVDIVYMAESKKWILKRADLPKEALRRWGSAIVKDIRVDWLEDEPFTEA